MFVILAYAIWIYRSSLKSYNRNEGLTQVKKLKA